MDNKKLHRGLQFSAEVAPLVSHMPAVDEYRETLLRLQGVWDSLSMLGQMSGAVPDIGATRSAFDALTGTLLDNLARRLLGNVVSRQAARAQVAIDILVRNLFERTADVGFLSTDVALREHVAHFHTSAGAVPEAARRALEARFGAYVAKYSVYDDVVVLSNDGHVLARLDRSATCQRSTEPWLARAAQGRGYLEQHGRLELFDGRPVLIYAAAIRAELGASGVLCLSFRLGNEAERIFGQLLGHLPDHEAADAGVIALLDPAGRVVVISDPWQVPVGAPLRKPGAAATGWRRLRFAGRDYLAVDAQATPYEGYCGPGWSALALVPLDLAFEEAVSAPDDSAAADDAASDLASRLDMRQLFDAELMAIGPQAQRIEVDLARLLWNGKLRRRGDAAADSFATTLLGEVGRTGERIRTVFDEATGALHRSTLQAVFDQTRHHARLAIDIVDRNLYERANDCRWWALDGVLRSTLAAAPDARDLPAATAVLRHINGLYTVYSLLLLFDANGRVVAVSDPEASSWIGRPIAEPWVRETLALRDSESHAVSRHVPSALYGGRPTYVYAAALRSPQSDGGAPTGGIAIVFDGAPQFEAMLRDALPRGATQACGLLVSRAGEVLASTDARWPVGGAAPQPRPWAALSRGASGSAVIDLDGVAHAVGYAVAGGYREYPVAARAAADDPVSLVIVRLGARLPAAETPLADFKLAAAAHGMASAPEAALLRVASFRVGSEWLGLPAETVVEALGAARLTALPNAPRHVLGMLERAGRMIPVLDLALLRGAHRPSAIDAPLIVLQGRGEHSLALRVDGLGEVFELPSLAIQHVRCGIGPGPAREEQLVGGLGQALSLLDLEPLWERLAPPVSAPPASPTRPSVPDRSLPSRSSSTSCSA